MYLKQNLMTTSKGPLASTVVKDMLALTVLLTVVFGIMLGSRPLSIPDEGRYVEIPREMVATGDYVTPRLNGVKYFEKPVLFYWLQAFMIKTFGIQEWSLRALPALFGILGCLLVFWAGLQLWGRSTAWFCAGVLATSTLYYAHTRIIILDLAVSVFIALAYLSFLLALKEPPGWRRHLYTALFFIGCAGGTLTKGLIGVVLPGGGILLWVLLFKRWEAFKLAFTPWGILLYLALTLPWHILAAMQNPNFFDFYIIHEHFTRFLNDAHGRTQPIFFFIPIVLLGLFPWVFFAFQSIRKIYKERSQTFQEEVYLLCWIGFVFTFFSIGKSKLIPYIVPIFPAFALLIGSYIANIYEKKSLSVGYSRGVVAYCGFCGLLAIAVWVGLIVTGKIMESSLWPIAIGLTILMLGTGALVLLWRRKPRWAIGGIFVNMFFFMWTINGVWPVFERPGTKPIAMRINDLKKPGDHVVGYHRYYQDLTPYINQTIKVVEWDGELKSGMKWEDTSSWMLKEHQFWPLWEGEQRVFAVMRKESYYSLQKQGHKNLYFLMEFGRDVLITNRPLKLMQQGSETK